MNQTIQKNEKQDYDTIRAVRGGSWYYYREARYFRNTYQYHTRITTCQHQDRGFRCAIKTD